MTQYGIDYMNNDKIKVGVIDSGFDIKGCKIKNEIIKKYSFKNEKINIDSNIQDEHGHGTGVTKIIDDVCDNIEFVIFKVLNEKCQGRDWQLISALKLAIIEKVDILNISLGTTNKKEEVILGELCDLAKKSGIIIVTTCPNDENTISFPYEFESVIKCKGNPKITDFNIYYDSNNIFWGRGIHHLIPWLNGNFTYSGSNSFSTPYVVIKIVEILKKNRNIDRKNILEELKKECQPITELKELIIKEEKCNRLELYKDVKEIIQNLLGKPIADMRLTLQGMTPELSLEVIKKIEERYHRTVSYSAYNYIDFEYISNIVNRIRFIDD